MLYGVKSNGKQVCGLADFTLMGIMLHVHLAVRIAEWSAQVLHARHLLHLNEPL